MPLRSSAQSYNSGCCHRLNSGHSIFIPCRRSQPKRVIPCWRHCQSDSLPIAQQTRNFETKPFTKTWVMNFRPSAPKFRRQPALNLKMIQLQFDDPDVLGKIAPHVPRTDMQSGDFATLELCSDHHRSSRSLAEKSAYRARSLTLCLSHHPLKGSDEVTRNTLFAAYVGPISGGRQALSKQSLKKYFGNRFSAIFKDNAELLAQFRDKRKRQIRSNRNCRF